MTYLLLAVIGFLGGISSGLFGVGGGLVFGPLLILLMGFNPHLAVGTALAMVIPTAVIGVIQHIKVGHVDWKIMPVILVFSMIGAWIGAHLSIQADAQMLKRFYAAFLVLVALKIFFTK